jgi:long-chain-fatty-acid--CoA ligase ACSBG
VAQDSAANVIVVENDAQLQKILKVKDQLPELKAIVQYTGDVKVPNREKFIYTVTGLTKNQ